MGSDFPKSEFSVFIPRPINDKKHLGHTSVLPGLPCAFGKVPSSLWSTVAPARKYRRGEVRFPLRLPRLTDSLLLQGWLLDPVTHIGCSVYKVAGDQLPVCRPGTGGLL